MNGQNQQIDMYAGDTLTISVTVYDGDTTTPTSITGATVRWVMFNRAGSIVLDKTNGSGVTITNGVGGVFEVALLPADTVSLSAGLYRHEGEVTDVSGRVVTVVTGAILIRGSKA